MDWPPNLWCNLCCSCENHQSHFLLYQRWYIHCVKMFTSQSRHLQLWWFRVRSGSTLIALTARYRRSGSSLTALWAMSWRHHLVAPTSLLRALNAISRKVRHRMLSAPNCANWLPERSLPCRCLQIQTILFLIKFNYSLGLKEDSSKNSLRIKCTPSRIALRLLTSLISITASAIFEYALLAFGELHSNERQKCPRTVN